MKGKRLVFPDQRQVVVEDFEVKDTPNADEVILENVYSIISPGTELAMFTKTHVGFPNPNNKYAKYPFKPGYAAAGKVIKAGDDAKAKGFKEGDLLMHRGGHATHHVGNVSPDQWSMLERVPAGVDPRHAMFSVFAEIALASVMLSHIQPGQSVAVFGQGLIGNFAAQLMRTAGAKRVVVFDPVPQRLQTSAKCGLKYQLDPTDAEWKKKLSDIVGAHGCQVVVEATGNPNVASQAIAACANFGKVVLLGSPRGSATLDLYTQVHQPGISLIGAHANHLNAALEFNSSRPIEVVLDYFADGRLTAEGLITHSLAAAQAGSAYNGLLEKPADYLGVVLDLKKWQALAMPEISLEQALQIAIRHHQEGRLREAEALYRQVLGAQPRNADALHLLGVVALQAGRFDSAADLIRRAIAINPEFPDAYNNLGSALQQQGFLDRAASAHRKALDLRPDMGDAHYNLGIVLQKQGKLNESVEAYRAVLRLTPNSALAHNNLGIVLAEKGELEEAVAEYILALQYDPEFFKAYNNLGLAQLELSKSDEALAAFSKAIQIKPDYALAYNSMANALKDRGQLDRAIEFYRRAVDLAPADPAFLSNLVYTVNFHPGYDAGAILVQARQWDARHALPLTIGAHGNDRSPDRRLKIGYLSPDLRNHPVGRSLLPLLAERDRARCEIYCYNDARRGDAVTEKLRDQSDQWRDVAGLSNEKVAEIIRRDQIDILADTTLHTSGNRLIVLALKPAPIQVTLLGPPITTGLSTMDYRITDPHLDPPEADEHYSEKSIRLPHCFWLYQPQAQAPEVNALPAGENGFVTFGCLNQFSKVTAPALHVWSDILQALPQSRLILQSIPGNHLNVVRKIFADKGIVEGRLEFVARLKPADYFRLYHRIDLSLDPFPFNGHTSTLDSLWMGVPTVTLAGATAVARGGVSILTNLGLPQLIAHSHEEYISIAISMANNSGELVELRSTLRQRMQASPLMDSVGYARDVEAAYRTLWRNWCSK